MLSRTLFASATRQLARPTPTPTAAALAQCRSFHTTLPAPASYKARKGMISAVRVVSKRARAAKEKRKAAVLQRLDHTTKMKINDALDVLQAASIGPRADTLSLHVNAKLGSGIAVPKGRYKLARPAKEQTQDVILVFAEGRQADDAKRAGAHHVGGIELIEPLASGRIPATTVLCTPALIRAITPRLGRVLGPKGLMPSARRGTVTEDFAGFLRNLVGTQEWKADREGRIRIPFAKTNWPREDITKNFDALIQSVKVATGNTKQQKANAGAHSATLTKVLVNTTQGPGVGLIEY
ncbi:ribosomal protein L1 [Cylindrobasidium torrendii FP15055 ss-10]|uniref:Ribosomal protein n=1 Tax=Cylindrobasidium torrendii FP15055 ss-10 TaxID=1314674 RepID=A0A0D7B723_9AGAR|nr:ribosomal protein L1 [Cylindrobasidium torrendii FP15055 ss-10]